MKIKKLLLACICGVMPLIALLALLGLGASQASASSNVLYVTHDCSVITSTHCYNSIQAAIDAAQSGDSVRVAEGVFTETVALSKSLTLQGGWNISFTVRNWTIYSTTIDAQRGGPVIRVQGAVSPTIEGFIITGGDATSSALGGGGGIQIHQGAIQSRTAVIIRHNIISDNYACMSSACFGKGGGVYVHNSVAMLEHNAIEANTAKHASNDGGNGGGVYVGPSSLVTMTGNSVIGNSAHFSPPPGSVEGKGGGMFLDAGNVFAQSNHIEQNTAVYGGGAFVLAATGVISGNWIAGNEAVTRGGGLYLYLNATPVLDGNTIISNTVTQGDGGGVGIRGNSLPVTLTNHLIAYNHAGRNGGGVYVALSSDVRLVDNRISHNLGLHGGGVSIEASGGVAANNWITHNVAVTRGGGVYLYAQAAGALALAHWADDGLEPLAAAAAPTMDFTANQIGGNEAIYGGGVFVESAAGAIADNWITDNVAATRGGGLYVYRQAAPTLDNNWVLSNTVTAGEGGGICIKRGMDVTMPVTLTNHTIAHNVASTDGGGMYISESPAVHLSESAITHNTAGWGGGVFVQSSGGTMAGNWITHNVAITWGGGVYLDTQLVSALDSSRLSGDDAVRAPGLAYAYNGPVMHVTDSHIDENTANYGGGIFVQSSVGDIARNWLVGNGAAVRGGGLYLYTQAAPRLDANHILSNTVVAGEGGGVCIRGDSVPVTLTNHIIAHNSATRDGGGVYIFDSPAVKLINNTLSNNNQGGGQEGVALLRSSLPSMQVTLVNNIIAGHSVAITVASGCAAALSHNDYYSNTINVYGQSAGATDLTLNPQFVNWAAGDYHLVEESPLVDAGDNSVKVPHDFEGQVRPGGQGIDIGADEFPRYSIYLPVVMRNTLSLPDVRVHETTLSLLTADYQRALVLSNPWDPIYPYHYLDFDQVGPKAQHSYRAIVLENAYVRVTVLPELGGRVYSWVDKTTGRAIAYSNPVIKPTPWGYRGWWLATGGIEWCLPTDEHGLNEYRPWDVITSTNAITVSDHEDRTGLDVTVTLSLDSAHNYLIIQPQIANHTGAAQDFKFWLNAMLAFSNNHVADSTHLIMPTTLAEIHSTGDPRLPAPYTVIDWPIYNSIDLSVVGNLQGWLGVFAYPNASASFAGAYDTAADFGVARIFPTLFARGVKFFTGRGLDSSIWTDDDSAYFELWGGVSPTFADQATLASGATLSWTERWYPVSGLGGRYDYANELATLRLDDQGSSVQVGVATSINLSNARIKLWRNQQVAAEWTVTLGPGEPANLTWQPGGGALGLQLLDAGGVVLAQTGTVGP